MTFRIVTLAWLLVVGAPACGGAERPEPAAAATATATASAARAVSPPAVKHEKPAAAFVSLAWSDTGLAVVTCGDEEAAHRTLVTPNGAQFSIAIDYPQAGFSPYRRGIPQWQPGTDVVALPDDRGVVLWDAKQRQMVRRLAFDGGTDAPLVTWSPSGQFLATSERLTVREMGEVSRPLLVWNVGAGTSQSVRQHAGDVVSWNANDKVVATGKGTILSLYAPTVIGDEVIVSTIGMGRRSLPGHTPSFDPTGRHLAVAAGLDRPEDGKRAVTTIYEARSLAKRAQVPGLRPQWNADGTVLMTQAEKAIIITSADGKEKARFPAAGGAWPIATLSPDGKRVALRGLKELTIWDVATNRTTKYPTQDDGVPSWITRDVVFTQGNYEGATLVSLKDGATSHVTATSTDGGCQLHVRSSDDTEGPAAWARVFGREAAPSSAVALEPAPATETMTLHHGKSPPGINAMEVTWSADDGAFVAHCREPKTRTLVDVVGLRKHALPAAADLGRPATWNPTSTHIALHTAAGTVVVERASGKTTASLPTPGATDALVVWGPPSNPSLAVSWVADPEHHGARVVVLDPKTGKVQTTVKVPPSKRNARVRWKPDGTRLLTLPNVEGYANDPSSTLRVWDSKSGRQLSSFTPKAKKNSLQAPRYAGWHPTDDVIYTSTGSGGMFNMWSHTAEEVHLWSAAGRPLGSLPGYSWSIDGGTLALVAGHDYRSEAAPSTTFYDLSTRKALGTVVGTLRGLDADGKRAVTTVSPYSNHNARSGEPVVFWLWRLPDGTPLRRLVLGRDSEQDSVRHVTGQRYAAWRPPYAIASGKRPAGFTVWDLATSRRVVTREFDMVVEFFGQTWLSEGRVLQLSYMDGRQRFIDVEDGRWVDVMADGTSCDVTLRNEEGPTDLAALKELLRI